MKHNHMTRAGYLLIALVLFLTTTFIAQMQQSIIAIDLDWSSDGTKLLAGYNTGDVRVFDAVSEQTLFQTQLVADGVFTDAAWSPTDSNIFAYAEANLLTYVGTVSVIDVSSGQLIASFNIEEDARAIAWNPDGTRLAVVAGFSSGQYLGSRPIKIWNVFTGEIEAFILGGFEDVSSVAWSPDGSRLASASANTTITIWDANTGNELNVLIGHTYPIHDVIWSPDGTKLASSAFGFPDSTLRIWDAATGANLVTIPEQFAFDLVWNPDGIRLAVADYSNVVRIWDTRTGELLNFIEQASDISQIAWNPTGDTLAFSSINNTFDLSVIQFPVANAGPDQTVTDSARSGSEIVRLDGSTSSDPDGTIVSYEWGENGTVITTGVNPQVNLGVGVHEINLTVTDNDGARSSDVVTITVQFVATSCDSSVASNDTVSLVSAINAGNNAGIPYPISLP